MGGTNKIQAPKPQEYTPVYQKDGNYYKRDAPKQSAKGNAMHGPQLDHNGNPMKVTKGKGKASVPSYTQIGGGMSQTADMPKSANRFQLGNYKGLIGRGGQPIRQPAGRRPNGYLGDPYAGSQSKNQIAPYRANAGQMNHLGKGIF